jgi:DNA-binding GntR family transcriptional regulator
MAEGGPLLLAVTASIDAGGRVVERARTFYRGDRYRFQSSLVRRR